MWETAGDERDRTGMLGFIIERKRSGMKVQDIINRIGDIKLCRDYLKDLADGKIDDPNQICALAEDIDEHLDAYTELLVNKEVKWNV